MFTFVLMDRLANDKTFFCQHQKYNLWFMAAKLGFDEMERRFRAECKRSIFERLSRPNGLQELVDEGIPQKVLAMIVQNLAMEQLYRHGWNGLPAFPHAPQSSESESETNTGSDDSRD